MEVLDIVIKILAIINSTIVTMMVFLMMKLLKCLRVMEDVDIGLLRPVTLHLVIAEFIIVVIMVEEDLSFLRPTTITLIIVEFIIMLVIVEVDLGLMIPATPARVDVDGRGGYRYYTSHSSSHNGGVHGRLLSLSVSSFPVDNTVHKD